MKVYLLRRDEGYEDYWDWGIFSSLEKAFEAALLRGVWNTKPILKKTTDHNQWWVTENPEHFSSIVIYEWELDKLAAE